MQTLLDIKCDLHIKSGMKCASRVACTAAIRRGKHMSEIKGRDHLENVHVDEMVTLKLNLNE
jgi:hypothetical protein